MTSRAIGPDGKIYCKHMEEAAKRTSHTPKHPNREFYCCKRASGDPTRCNFWRWADELLAKDDVAYASGSAAALPSPQPASEETGTREHQASSALHTPHSLRENFSPNSPSVTPRSRRRLDDIEAGLKQRELDLSPTRLSREFGPSTPSASAQAIPQPSSSPVPTEVDDEADTTPPKKTYSFLGLHYSPELTVSTIKDEGQPSTPKKQRLITPNGGTTIQPTTDGVSSGGGLLPTPPKTTRRVARARQPESIPAITPSRKGKERDGPLVQTQHQKSDQHHLTQKCCAQYDSSETGDSGEPQEDTLPLFTLPEDISTTSSVSPTTAENVLDYTDGMKARVKALSEYMSSYDITQATKLLQTVERQKTQYEYRDGCQKRRIEELVVENGKLVAEVARLEEALQR